MSEPASSAQTKYSMERRCSNCQSSQICFPKTCLHELQQQLNGKESEEKTSDSHVLNNIRHVHSYFLHPDTFNLTHM